jgi:hypothetical protein
MPTTVFDTKTTASMGDSVEFCPHSPWQQFFACGNYEQTDRDKAIKVGKVYMFQVQDIKESG